jgi:muconolactone delta-isomerase
MKFLAIEKELAGVDWSAVDEILKREAKQVLELFKQDKLREIYFTDDHRAVLILECSNRAEAKEILNSLPLVQQKMIGFELMSLLPYTGFDRLIEH